MALGESPYGVLDEDGVGDERAALFRGRYFERTTDLNAQESLALAWSELGYSKSGVATAMDSTEGTVEKYLHRAIAQYGHVAVETKWQEQRGDLAEITAEGYEELRGTVRDCYIHAAHDNPDVVPESVWKLVSVSSSDGVGDGDRE